MCGRKFLCKIANNAWEFLEDLSDDTFERDTTRKAASFASNIFTNNDGNMPNDFVALDSMVYCEHPLEVSLFRPPQPHDYNSSACC